MNRLSLRERVLLSLALLALVTFVSLALLLLPLRRQSSRLSGEEKSLQQKIADAELMYRSLPRVKEELADLQSKIAALSRVQPNPTPDVVREIERLTSSLGVQLSSVRPAEPEYADNCTKFPTTFEVQSTFSDLTHLLYELERPPYNLWVEGAELNADREANVLRAAVTVSVYSCKPDSKADDEKG
jgi:Tfp pilus assembly protein PilO